MSWLRSILSRRFGIAVRFGFRPLLFTPSVLAEYPWRLGWDEEAEIRRAVKLVREHSALSWERLASLWQQVRYVDQHGIPGALVECGIWRGGATGMMALAHSFGGKPQRALHLFDSFRGMPRAREGVDGPVEIKRSSQPGLYAVTADVAMQLLERLGYPKPLTFVHEGWFENTVPSASVGPIAVLRLDGDWYDSTRVCLTHLEPLVVTGGVVIIDDYGQYVGARRAVDEYLASTKQRVLMHHLDYSGRAWVKQD